MSINTNQVPNAPGGYSLVGKEIMVHDPTAPITANTVMVAATVVASGGTNYAAPMWTEAGGNMTAGSFTFTHASLIGATQMNFIIVNKINEYIGDDYTFNSGTGTITRINAWQAGDKLITPHKPSL